MATSRSLAATAVTSLPSTSTRPDVGISRPARIRSVVLLPEPDGPSSAKNSPGSILKSTPFRALKVPCILVMLSKCTCPRPLIAGRLP